MSLWQFAAAVGGFAKFHGAKEGLMPEEAESLSALLDEIEATTLH